MGLIILLELVFPMLVVGTCGAIIGLPFGDRGRSRKYAMLGGFCGGVVGGILGRVICSSALQSYFSSAPKERNEMGMGGFVSATPYLVAWGSMLLTAAIVGIAGARLGIVISKRSPRATPPTGEPVDERIRRLQYEAAALNERTEERRQEP